MRSLVLRCWNGVLTKFRTKVNGITPELAALETQLGGNKLEWRYEMRREAQEILPGVFVGPFQPSYKLEILQSLGITHVLCIAEIRERSVSLFPAQFAQN